MMTIRDKVLRAATLQECRNCIVQLEKERALYDAVLADLRDLSKDTKLSATGIRNTIRKAIKLSDDICFLENTMCRDTYHWEYNGSPQYSWGADSERTARMQKRFCRLMLAQYYYDLIREQLG